MYASRFFRINNRAAIRHSVRSGAFPVKAVRAGAAYVHSIDIHDVYGGATKLRLSATMQGAVQLLEFDGRRRDYDERFDPLSAPRIVVDNTLGHTDWRASPGNAIHSYSN